jgi:hypothetical protein
MTTPHTLPAIPRSQHLRWLELASLTRGAAEFVILLAWYAALPRPTGSLTTVGAVLAGLMVTCFLLVRLAERQDLSAEQQNFVIILWVVVFSFASFQPNFYPHTPLTPLELFTVPMTALLAFDSTLHEFWHLVILTLIAWRGITAGRRLVTVQSAMNSFRTGLVLLLIYGTFYTTVLPFPVAMTMIGAFFFFILVSLTAARVAEVGEMRGGRIPRLNTDRGMGILAGALLTAVFASLLALLSVQVGPIVTALVLALLALMAVILLILATPLLTLVVWLLSRIPAFSALETDMMESADVAQETVEAVSADLSQSMDLMTVAGRPILMLLVLIGLFVLIFFALRARPRPIQTKLELDSEQSLTRKRFRMPPILEALQNRNRLPGFGQTIAAARIRQTYNRMLKLCLHLGTPRPPAATPTEFLPRIQKLFTEDNQAAEIITHAYNEIRYGEYPETQEEVQVVLKAWQQIESSGRQMQKQRKINRRTVKERSESRWG